MKVDAVRDNAPKNAGHKTMRAGDREKRLQFRFIPSPAREVPGF
jgi:hypothetical protein